MWDYGCLNNFDILTLFIAYGTYTHYINVLPPFQPNDYLFEKHADKGTEKWEIYAWAVRDVIAKVNQLEKSEISLRDKLTYFDYMYGRRKDLPRYTDGGESNKSVQDNEMQISKNVTEPML